jgi:hypothetical protein
MVIAQRKSRRQFKWPKQHLKQKMTLESKLNIEFRRKLVRCNVWIIALNGSETWALRKWELKY